MEKLWYAVLRDSDDNDWGYGTFDLDEAKEKARRLSDEAYIVAIDGGYDSEGNETTDPIAVWELHQDEF